MRSGRAVLELLEPAANAAASEAAWRLVRERFTIDTVVDTLLEVYARVTAGTSPPLTCRSSLALSPICQR